MKRLVAEVAIVLCVTFGMAGVKALLRLIDAAQSPLNQHKVVLNDAASALPWIDISLQRASALTLFAWGALALYLLERRLERPAWRDLAWGAGLAALLGLPGLALYGGAFPRGFAAEVVPATDASRVPLLLLWSAANAFSEEMVGVLGLVTRLRQLKVPVGGAVAGSAVLRGSYHLYQGFSAGLGNVVMGVVFAWFFARTGKVWPLILAHFLIDVVAYVGYLMLDLSWLGL